RQLARPRALAITAILLGALALVPGLPLWPFALVGLAAGGLSFYLQRARRSAPRAAIGLSLPRASPALEVAVDHQLAAQLRAATPGVEERLAQVARALSDDLGLPLPPVALTVDARLPLRGYEVRLRGVPVAQGRVPDGRLLADAGPAALPPGIDAEPAEHPATGALASWVPSSAGARLRAAGIGLLDGSGCVAASLEASLRASAAELLGLDETQRLLAETARTHPALVREVVPRRIDVAGLADVLRRLVAEALPVGDLRDVLETIARQKDPERDPALLTERVR